MVEGNSVVDLRRWPAGADPDWLAGIQVVATDLAESFRAGLSPHLDHARQVAEPFHVVRVANRDVDKVRRRAQSETLGHRGRDTDPSFKIRELTLTGAERPDERGTERMLGLRAGDPNEEVLGRGPPKNRSVTSARPGFFQHHPPSGNRWIPLVSTICTKSPYLSSRPWTILTSTVFGSRLTAIRPIRGS